jgi:hypothetical protein
MKYLRQTILVKRLMVNSLIEKAMANADFFIYRTTEIVKTNEQKPSLQNNLVLGLLTSKVFHQH